MKKIFSLFLFLTISIVSFAQINMLAGKITDENNNLVPNAIIKLQYVHQHIITAKTDEHGLYYTQQLQPGNYSITIVTNGREIQGKRLHVPADENQFYNFCLKKHKAILERTKDDPFMAAKLAEINNQDSRKTLLFDPNKFVVIIQIDSSMKDNSIISQSGTPKIK